MLLLGSRPITWSRRVSEEEDPRINKDGSVQPGHPVLYYQPFSTTDLLNWKHHTPSYSEKLQVVIDLLESIPRYLG